MSQRFFAFLAIALVPSIACGDEAIRQEIISFSERVKQSFKPTRTTFFRQSLIDGSEASDIYLQKEDSFLYESDTAACVANADYSFFLDRTSRSDPWRLNALKHVVDTAEGTGTAVLPDRNRLELTEHTRTCLDPANTKYLVEVEFIKGACYPWLKANSWGVGEYLQVPGSTVEVARSGEGDDAEVFVAISVPKNGVMPCGVPALLVRVHAKYLPNMYGWIPVETQGFWPKGDGRCIRKNRRFTAQGDFFVPLETEVQFYGHARSIAVPLMHGVTWLDYDDGPVDEERFKIGHYDVEELVVP